MVFNIGDRVVCLKSISGNKFIVGEIGTVIGFLNTPEGPYIEVEFDNHIRGHNCDGKGKNGFCWRIPEGYLKYAEDPLKAYNDTSLFSKIARF